MYSIVKKRIGLILRGMRDEIQPQLKLAIERVLIISLPVGMTFPGAAGVQTAPVDGG